VGFTAFQQKSNRIWSSKFLPKQDQNQIGSHTFGVGVDIQLKNADSD